MRTPLLCPTDLLNLDLSSRTYIVTGGNSGIGLVTVEQLAKQGAHVVLACRRVEEGQQKAKELLSQKLRGTIEVSKLDLADLNSVRAFAKHFLENHTSLHGLVNNAGVMNTTFQRTKDGFEMQFGTNHLGHYLLTELLLPLIKKSAPSRIVCVSSCFHDKAMGYEGRIDFEDLNFEKRKYNGWVAYGQSKLANLLHAKQLARRLTGTGVTTASVHPGWVRTNLIHHSMPRWVQDKVLRPFFKLGGMIEPWEGAQSTLYALLSPEAADHNGAFFSQTGIYRNPKANRGGWPLKSPNPQANDETIAEKLDEVSRKLVGLGS
ncbi:MAG: SDR family oxidoreductase [Proteobacteria bacterium]|nr:SDR family oxidoreductase [Pseudomonadota bacterium]